MVNYHQDLGNITIDAALTSDRHLYEVKLHIKNLWERLVMTGYCDIDDKYRTIPKRRFVDYNEIYKAIGELLCNI